MVAANGPHDRLPAIQRRIAEQGSVRIPELAVELAVSEMTIRRDLDELEKLGVARRVRGGAVALGPEPFDDRNRHQARAKGRIAEKLLKLLPQRGTVAFDASSTVHRLAAVLEGARDLVVVTNGVPTFLALQDKPGIAVTLTGGTREPRTGSLVGPIASRSAEDFLFDVLICSGTAIDARVGSSEASLAEAEVKRSLGASSERIVVAVDHSKLERRGDARMFRLDQIDVLVTDLDPDDPRLRPYRADGLTLL
ncbi:DeoR/GlpR transcriptional regulator [Nitriliruptoraceae bacterium ZYF776]|nr:DeoR/GlpR transcriptional regulator [Profundirhabdus halotolerans]